jgi:hypothetical protein
VFHADARSELPIASKRALVSRNPQRIRKPAFSDVLRS